MHAWKSKKLFNNVSPPVVPSSLLSTMYCGRVLAENINHNKDIMSNNMVHPCSTASRPRPRSPPLFFILRGAHCGVCARACEDGCYYDPRRIPLSLYLTLQQKMFHKVILILSTLFMTLLPAPRCCCCCNNTFQPMSTTTKKKKNNNNNNTNNNNHRHLLHSPILEH